MTIYYGFKVANHSEEPAWFHTQQAAHRFNLACGGHMGEIETASDVDSKDVLDTKDQPWGTMRDGPRLDMAGDAIKQENEP